MKLMSGCMVCAVLLAALPAVAGGAGTESPFSLGAGARSLGLGTADLVRCGPSVAAYWNPAALALTERYSFEAFHSRLYDSDAGYQYFGLAIPTVDFGSLGLGIFRLGVDGIEKRDAGNLYLGQISDSRLGFYIGYGNTVSNYDIGAAISVEHHAPDEYSATSSPGLTLAIGRRFSPPSRRLPEVGVAVVGRNLVRPSIKLDEESVTYPYSIDGSLSVEFLPTGTRDHRITVSGRFTKVENTDGTAAFGVEYRMQDLIGLRAGLRDGEASFGVGFFYKYVGFDYAMVKRDLGTLHTFGISAGLGVPVGEKRRLRAEKREAEFDRLLSQRFARSSRTMIDDLVRQGEKNTATGDILQALTQYEKALFIAATADMDTVDLSGLVSRTRAQLKIQEVNAAYNRSLEDAQSRFAAGDYLGARYFADLALSIKPGSAEAARLQAEADALVEASITREQEIERGLMIADSLTSYGDIDEAVALMRSLVREAGDDPRVQLGLKKTEFAHWREVSDDAYSRADYRAAGAALDSAAVRFPDHPWCANLSRQLDAQARRSAPAPEAPRTETPAPAVEDLSPEMRKEVAATYKRGQDFFEKGMLAEAVAEWERVDALAPGYMSVREYLVDAYKFLGVELYTRNKLGEAVNVWKKAASISPDSTEITNYIKRTEHEISKLQEMSYERR
jgi:tetratricopeptide (TPR) repeat protein